MSVNIDHSGTARHNKGAAGGRGGQYATKVNSTPSESLTENESHKKSSALTAEAIRESQRILERTARSITRSYRIDPTHAEDIVQDSWVHLLERDKRYGDIEDRASETPFLNLVARKFATDYSNDKRFGLRSEDFSARRLLRAQASEFRAEHGRKMTPSEYQAAAEEIRMSFPSGSRPKVDFYKEITQISLDAAVGKGGDSDTKTTRIDLLSSPESSDIDEQEVASAHALHRLNNAADKRVSDIKNDIRSDIWRVVSTRVVGAPQPRRGSINKVSAAKHRQTVKKYGGAMRLGEAWREGETTPEQDDALFAPFGDLDNKQRELVIEVLNGNSRFADHIWNSSLTAAAR